MSDTLQTVYLQNFKKINQTQAEKYVKLKTMENKDNENVDWQIKDQ